VSGDSDRPPDTTVVEATVFKVVLLSSSSGRCFHRQKAAAQTRQTVGQQLMRGGALPEFRGETVQNNNSGRGAVSLCQPPVAFVSWP